MEERRAFPRRRVRLGGRLASRNALVAVECQVLSLSDAGATVEGNDIAMLPRSVTLTLLPRGEKHDAHFIWRDGRRGGLHFERSESAAAVDRDHLIRKLRAENQLLHAKLDGSEV